MTFSEENGFFLLKKTSVKVIEDPVFTTTVTRCLVWKLVDFNDELGNWLRTRIALPKSTVKLIMWYVSRDKINGVVDDNDNNEPIGSLIEITALRACSFSKQGSCFFVSSKKTTWTIDESDMLPQFADETTNSMTQMDELLEKCNAMQLKQHIAAQTTQLRLKQRNVDKTMY
jgi:hypothetical protein